jgi:hypothetical protein
MRAIWYLSASFVLANAALAQDIHKPVNRWRLSPRSSLRATPSAAQWREVILWPSLGVLQMRQETTCAASAYFASRFLRQSSTMRST